MEVDFEDFGQKKKKAAAYTKPAFWVRCLECRAIYSSRVSAKYDVCVFCDGANWSDDKEGD